MNCDLWRSSLIEVARGRLSDINESESNESNRARAHARACLHCGLFLEEQMALTAAVAAVAVDPSMAPPADLESVLLAEFVSSRSRHHRSLRSRLAMAAAIAVAAAAVAWVMAIQRVHVPARPDVSQPLITTNGMAATRPGVGTTDGTTDAPISKPIRKRSHKPSAAPAADEAPFVAIPYTVPLASWERATVMRMEMPATALAAVGLTTTIPDPRASAQTDVIVGEDGRIRAIRILSISTSNTDRSINQ